VHGDVRPGTVRLSRDGQVKLAVFDSIRAADDAWSLAGSEPGFRAPELLAGEAPDPRTDVYGAGVILFELLTGRPLFAPDRRRTVADQIRRGRIPRLRSLVRDLPAELERVVLTAVDRRRDKRFGDAETFLQALLTASVPRYGTASTRDLAALVERALDPFTPRGEGEGEWSLGAAGPGAADPAWAAGDGTPRSTGAMSGARRSLVTVVLTTAALSGAAGAAWYLRLF
jgi:serine/threonine-protein kinase